MNLVYQATYLTQDDRQIFCTVLANSAAEAVNNVLKLYPDCVRVIRAMPSNFD